MKKTLCALIIAFATNNLVYADPQTNATAPVSGFAQAFLYNKGIPNGTITVLETGATYKTGKDGDFGPFQHPVGKPITLVFEKSGYTTTQSATVIVPPEGLQGPYNNMTFQVPTSLIFFIMKTVMGAKIDVNSCHVATTITAYHKTLHDIPQGEVNAKIVLTPTVNVSPFYFGIFKSGPLKDKTSPFSKTLTQTSEDGGVAFFNLPPRDEPYILSAEKFGTEFTKTQFLCRKDMFINLSPPHGPMALK